jgi:hypothetical protein
MFSPFRVLSLVGAFALITVSPARADVITTNLITNGSFETPITGNFLDITAGAEPAGFGWRVTSGSVDVVVAGPNFASTAFDLNQFLDLDGFAPGAIAQSFATTPGSKYFLNFAYANNPQGSGIPSPSCPFGGPCATIPATATVSVFDSGTSSQLITPFVVTHGDSTVANPDWITSGAIGFIANGTTTTLSFVSNDPPSSDGGISLDGVSVNPAGSAVPEPSSLLLLGTGLIVMLGLNRSKFARLHRG